MHQERTYRNQIRESDLAPFRLAVQETDLYIHSKKPLEEAARDLVLDCRGQIEGYIAQHPAFAGALAPWAAPGPYPPVIREMVTHSAKAGVGPMASVAGAVAEFTGRGLLSETDEVIVENGGDLFIRTVSPITIGIYAGKSPLSMRMGLKVDRAGDPFAVCTSSGTIGHSLSLGKADAVCIVSPSTALADAAATATANRIATPGDIEAAIGFAKNIPGVEGVVAVIDDKMGLWGDLELVRL